MMRGLRGLAGTFLAHAWKLSVFRNRNVCVTVYVGGLERSPQLPAVPAEASKRPDGLARVPLRAREIAASPVEGHHSEPGTMVTILPSHDPNAPRGAKGSSQRIATMRGLHRTEQN